MLGILDIFDTRQLYVAIFKYFNIRYILVAKLINNSNLIIKPVLLQGILFAFPSLFRIYTLRHVSPVFHKLNPYNTLITAINNILNHLDIIK